MTVRVLCPNILGFWARILFHVKRAKQGNLPRTAKARQPVSAALRSGAAQADPVKRE